MVKCHKMIVFFTMSLKTVERTGKITYLRNAMFSDNKLNKKGSIIESANLDL